MLIVLEGIDGSGKTTLAPLVCDRLSRTGMPAAPLLKKFVDYDEGYRRRHLTRLRHVIWGERKPKVDAMGGEHWALLIAAWYAVLSRERLHRDELWVSDGWFYRNLAKSMEDAGLDEVWLRSLFAPVVPPDLVVLVDVSPEIVARRGRRFDARESGGWAVGGPVDFRTYQARIREHLLRMAREGDWSIVPVGEADTPEVVADAIAELTAARLGWVRRLAG